MRTQFTKKAEDKDKYIRVTYHPTSEVKSMKLKMNSTQYCLSDADAEVFIDKTIELKKAIENELTIKNLPYNIDLLILVYLQVIEFISTGSDIRSKLTNEQIAENMVEGYRRKFTESLQFCEKTIKMFEDGECNESYTKHWKDYDKHNELVDEYMFDLRKFKDGDFQTSLDSMNKKASELLNYIKGLTQD